MLAKLTYRKRIAIRKKTKRLWMSVVLVLSMALAVIAVVAAEAQAGSFDHHPPKAVLIKPSQVLQEGRAGSSCWSYYYEGGNWTERCVDKVYGFPRADVVGAGKQLHIRLNKPQRPESFKIIAYPRLDEYGEPDYGVSKKLTRTFGRVERDGKTVAWNVFFRVNVPNRHYYLTATGNWKRVPDTHISYGEGMWFFHVKTR